MKRTQTLTTIIWLLFSANVIQLHAQDCNEKLELADEAYRKANFSELQLLLEECVSEEKLNKSQQIRALHLLTLGYLENEEDTKAVEVFKKLIYLEPDHYFDTTGKTDLIELKTLYDSYRTDPIIYISPMAGNNAFGFQILRYRGTDQGGAEGEKYSPRFGLQLGANFSFPLKWLKKDKLDRSNLRLRTGLHFVQSQYQFEDGLRTFEKGEAAQFNLQFTEKQESIMIPVGLSYNFDFDTRYNFRKKDILPFVYAGLNNQYLVRSIITDIRRDNENSSSENGLINDNITGLRNRFNIGFHIGGGVKVKILRSYLIVDASLGMWVRNMVNRGKVDEKATRSSQELLYIYGHEDNDLRLYYASVSIGIEMARYLLRKRNP